jgi:hypothetical protein
MKTGIKSWVTAAATAALLVTLQGCGTLKDLQRTNPDALFDAPDTRVTTAFPAGVLSGSSNCEDAWIRAQTNAIPSDVERFTAVMYCGIGGSRSHWARFAEVGRSLADRHCNIFMDTLEDRRVHVAFNQTNITTMIGVASAILAKVGGHTQAIFNLAQGQLVTNAVSENYKSHYIMSNSIHQLREKMKSGQAVLREEMQKSIEAQSYTSFDDAKDDLMDYGDWCSHKTLIHIINESLSATRYGLDSPESAIGKEDFQALLAVAKATDPSISLKALGNADMLTLFVFASKESAEIKKILEALDRETGTPAKSGWTTLLKSDQIAKVIKALKLETDEAMRKRIVGLGRLLEFERGQANPVAQQLADFLLNPSSAGKSAPETKRITVAATRSKLRLVPTAK